MMPHLADTPIIETERLILRAPAPQDWPKWHEFAVTKRTKFSGGPYTLGTAWRALGHVVGMWVLRGYGSFVITLKGDDTAIDMAGPWHPANWPEREISWTIWSSKHEGSGIAFEAALAVRQAAQDLFGLTQLASFISEGNERSVSLAQRLGAHLERTGENPDTRYFVYRHPTSEAVT